MQESPLSSPNSPLPSAKSLVVSRDAWGTLVLHNEAAGTSQPFIPVRMFPISDPSRWISLHSPSGKELFCIESLEDLDASTRKLMEAELATQGFFPVIERVLHVSSLSEPCEWTVLTDRGMTRFVLKSEDDVRRLSAHQAYLIDASGIRYLIRDARLLDSTSRHFVEWYL